MPLNKKKAKKCKIKISCSKSHYIETHVLLGNHRLRSFKK